MKKLILITGILLSTSLWADMNKICNVEGFVGKLDTHSVFIEFECERNNILEAKSIYQSSVTFVVSNYCRFDRNIHVQKSEVASDVFDLVCVLYSPKGRMRVIRR
tara:strand:- start:230 stop:544 length:315 start_codon:yes stop_codon:yes gene_type:complete